MSKDQIRGKRGEEQPRHLGEDKAAEPGKVRKQGSRQGSFDDTSSETTVIDTTDSNKGRFSNEEKKILFDLIREDPRLFHEFLHQTKARTYGKKGWMYEIGVRFNQRSPNKRKLDAVRHHLLLRSANRKHHGLEQDAKELLGLAKHALECPTRAVCTRCILLDRYRVQHGLAWCGLHNCITCDASLPHVSKDFDAKQLLLHMERRFHRRMTDTSDDTAPLSPDHHQLCLATGPESPAPISLVGSSNALRVAASACPTHGGANVPKFCSRTPLRTRATSDTTATASVAGPASERDRPLSPENAATSDNPGATPAHEQHAAFPGATTSLMAAASNAPRSLGARLCTARRGAPRPSAIPSPLHSPNLNEAFSTLDHNKGTPSSGRIKPFVEQPSPVGATGSLIGAPESVKVSKQPEVSRKRPRVAAKMSSFGSDGLDLLLRSSKFPRLTQLNTAIQPVSSVPFRFNNPFLRFNAPVSGTTDTRAAIRAPSPLVTAASTQIVSPQPSQQPTIDSTFALESLEAAKRKRTTPSVAALLAFLQHQRDTAPAQASSTSTLPTTSLAFPGL
ncbi:Uncharacterized protein SCF082_LOCUS51908 [Durusdinium trenchii]|uniref:Uncharacterized protein n=1 Tax=Durusdinium trenchii TaxID=1381693 RepID=A0ABP0SHR6_9DINO